MNISPPNILRLATSRLLILCALFACALLPVHAASLADLTYRTTDGEVTITDCDEGFAGELIIPDTIEGSPVTSIGNRAFRGCRSLTRITIPDSVTSIGYEAFRDCTSLTSVTIPDGVTSIGAEAFNRCTSLTSITIPDSVISVGFGTFSQCTSLTNIAIPDSVTSIGDYAFGTCTSLTNITIPDSVTSIGEFAFVDCISLMEVVLVGPAPEVQSDAFTSTADGALAFAKTEYIESYGGDRASWEGLTVREISSPPLLNLESFYESAPNQSLEIDALNFPTNYSTTTYQWFFNDFPIPERFGGNSPKITIDGLTSSDGAWTVTATNFLGESTATFEYRVFVDTDSDGFSDYREQNLTGTNFELADTDSDGLNDYQELIVFETDPTDSDSDDDGYEDGQEQGEGTDPNQAESYPQRTLTVPTVENGSVKGAGIFAFGTDATLEAIPDKGYVFQGWSDVSGVAACLQSLMIAQASGVNILNAIDVVQGKEIRMSGDVNHPDGSEFLRQNDDAKTICAAVAQSSYSMLFTIVMTSDRSIEAVFTKDEADPDEDGLTNYQELVLFETDPLDSDSDDDGFSDGQEQGEGTDPNETESFPTRVLTINDSANGTFTGGGVYQLGVTATLQAIPDTGYLFGGWVGEVIGESNPLSITMLVNQSVGANFEQDTRDSDEDGLSNYQELVVFNTDPTDSDSDDDGYLDGQEQTEGTDPNESNSYPTRSLATERVNNGSISGSGTYALGEEVVVTANPDPGFIFSWWSGNASGSVNPLAVIMTSNLSIGAAFVPDNRDNDGDGLSNFSELKIYNTDPNKFDSDGDGFSDGLEISERTNPNVSSLFPTRTIGISDSANGFVEGGGTYPLGVTIEVTASPSAGYLFFKWVGDVDGTENPLNLKISSNLNLEAIFQQDERDSDLDGLSNYQEIIVYNTDPNNPDSDGDGFNDGLEISEETNPNVSSVFPTRSLLVVAPLNGSVNSQAIYPLDAIATLTATPEPGYVFYSWGGDTISSQNPLPVVMSENRILSAIFNQDERDSDGDGLSNYDEIVIHATNPNQMDTDEDGFDDDEEILKGTDPNDSQAFPERKPIELRIEKLNVPSLVIFAYWTGEIGKTYRIEYAADFQNWNILDSGIQGTGLEQSRALPGPKGYVRVVEE